MTIDRVAMVQAHILDAILKTSGNSALPGPEQDRLLAQSCAEACDLLGDWLGSGWFRRARPADDGLLADAAPTAGQFAEFLGPIFEDALTRAAQAGVTIDVSDLQDARAKVAGLARRYRRMRSRELCAAAEGRVGALRDEVCQAATQLREMLQTADEQGPRAERSRHKARRALQKVKGLLPAVALTVAGAMLGVGPHQMAQSVSEWGHDAARVVAVYHIADLAQPTVRMAPPRIGPQVR
ncbi:MAG: hypothetical protein ABSF03_27205 [Streptosporangiaceae bacterium]